MKRLSPGRSAAGFAAAVLAALTIGSAASGVSRAYATDSQSGSGVASALTGRWADGPVACASGDGLRLNADGTASTQGLRGFWALDGNRLNLFLRPAAPDSEARRRAGYNAVWQVTRVDGRVLTVMAHDGGARLVRCGG